MKRSETTNETTKAVASPVVADDEVIFYSEKLPLADFAVNLELPNPDTNRTNDGVMEEAWLAVVAEEGREAVTNGKELEAFDEEATERRLLLTLRSAESQFTIFPFMRLTLPLSVSSARRLAGGLAEHGRVRLRESVSR